MKVLVIGSGGREHALVWKLRQSPFVDALWCAPGNAGIAAMARCVPVAADDLEGLERVAIEERIDLTVVGPEGPLVAGIVDRFLARGLRIVGPRAAAARLEGSKVFAKTFMERHGIPTAAWRAFPRTAREAALAFVAAHALPVVLKADGLAGGKGVMVCDTHEEAVQFVRELFDRGTLGPAGSTLVVEEFLAGEEASVFALTDGTRYVTFAPAQDHKRAGDGDTGKNTGGMGAFAPARIVTPQVLARVRREIIEPTLAGMRAEGCAYTGFLYCGLMLTAEGPKVVEYNCRLGDPEAQVVLPLLAGDLAALCGDVAAGRLGVERVGMRDATALCLVLTSAGYPDAYEKGKRIEGLEDAGRHRGVVVFHASTAIRDGHTVTAGGRVLGVTVTDAASLREAIARAYAAAAEIAYEGKTFRTDIGAKGLVFDPR